MKVGSTTRNRKIYKVRDIKRQMWGGGGEGGGGGEEKKKNGKPSKKKRLKSQNNNKKPQNKLSMGSQETTATRRCNEVNRTNKIPSKIILNV